MEIQNLKLKTQNQNLKLKTGLKVKSFEVLSCGFEFCTLSFELILQNALKR
jgi:hypothetical protein